MTDTHDYIAIGLPIPVTVFATLGDLINKAWPGADIIIDPGEAQVPPEVRTRIGYSRDVALLRVPKRAPRRVTKKAAQEIADGNARDEAAEEGMGDVGFLGFDRGSIRMTPPEDLCLLLGSICKRILDSNEDAINYLEWEVIDKDTHARTVLSAARSKGQTPHALRTRAEKKVARVRALAEEWRDSRDHMEQSCGADLLELLGD